MHRVTNFMTPLESVLVQLNILWSRFKRVVMEAILDVRELKRTYTIMCVSGTTRTVSTSTARHLARTNEGTNAGTNEGMRAPMRTPMRA